MLLQCPLGVGDLHGCIRCRKSNNTDVVAVTYHGVSMVATSYHGVNMVAFVGHGTGMHYQLNLYVQKSALDLRFNEPYQSSLSAFKTC